MRSRSKQSTGTHAATAAVEFCVGPTVYSAVLSDRSIYDLEGNELEGCAVEGRRLIILSRIIEPSRREEVAEHEFYHCWLFHVPGPKTEEEAAQLHQLVARQFRQDLEAAGGNDAFLSMRPTRIQLGRPAAHRATFTPAAPIHRGRRTDRVTCGTCDAYVMAGSITTDKPIPNEFTGNFHVRRWMLCPACDSVQVWHELAASDGTPLGEFCAVPQPKILRGEEAAVWLDEHSGATA